jgi:hypothetical protein
LALVAEDDDDVKSSPRIRMVIASRSASDVGTS